MDAIIRVSDREESPERMEAFFKERNGGASMLCTMRYTARALVSLSGFLSRKYQRLICKLDKVTSHTVLTAETISLQSNPGAVPLNTKTWTGRLL